MTFFINARAFLMVLALLTVAASSGRSVQIQITSGGAGWTWSVPLMNLPTVAGRDISVSTYSSDASQTVLRVVKGPGGWMQLGTGWIVTVSKIDAGWHPNLHLFIRRTSQGTPEGCLTGLYNAYIEVPDDPTDVEFFRCNSQTEVEDIDCQLQIQGLSVIAGDLNQTSIYYTVTEF